jgi:hypothetical protein
MPHIPLSHVDFTTFLDHPPPAPSPLSPSILINFLSAPKLNYWLTLSFFRIYIDLVAGITLCKYFMWMCSGLGREGEER